MLFNLGRIAAVCEVVFLVAVYSSKHITWFIYFQKKVGAEKKTCAAVCYAKVFSPVLPAALTGVDVTVVGSAHS